ncbi:MAG: glycoside hydrolase 43 family protein [Paludibacteraceae bacterium]|nr:glycoside hydrolase 43 family protein [Paludibacteraceae bacterium]
MKKIIVLTLTLSVFIFESKGEVLIPYDYPQPDVTQVDQDFYMVYSTFAMTPGLQILQSRDGLSWNIVDAALPDTIPGYGHKDGCRAGCGVWAPSIRYYDGRFYIFYGDPDIGIYCIRSANTKSIPCQWEPAVLVKRGKGLIDPCPLWDKDGRVYLVHAYAGSRAGIKSLLAVCELSSDALSVLCEDRIVFDGHVGNPTCKGPKFYKIDGWYYIFCPAGGVRDGWQLCLRSRSPYGPYEAKRVLEQGSTDVNGPHIGAWVWDMFYHTQKLDVAGQILHVQPLRWSRGWPIIGNNGEPAATFNRKMESRKFEIPDGYKHIPERDDFDAQEIFPYWQWSGNRQARFAACHADSSFLRLFTYPVENLQNAPNLLLRKIPAGRAFQIETRVRFTPLERNSNHEQAGFIVYGRQSRLLPVPDDGRWWLLRIIVSENQTCRLYRSLDGRAWEMTSEPFRVVPGEWMGARVGFYAIHDLQPTQDAGYLDVDWFNIAW